MEFVNLTPHAISLNDGRIFPPSGEIARVSAGYSEFVDGICRATFGQVTNLPAPRVGVTLIVSGMVAAAVKRGDVVAPATGHPDARRDGGQIVSVPGFVASE